MPLAPLASTTRRTARAATALLALIAIIATGCTSESEPDDPVVRPTDTSTVTPTSSTPTPTPSPTPTLSNKKPGEKPPVRPTDAFTLESAEAFATYVIQTMDWAYATLDTAEMRKTFGLDCSSCGRIADGFDEVRAKGHVLLGGRLTSIAAHGIDVANPNRVPVGVLLSSEARIEVDAAGIEVGSGPAENNAQITLYLAWIQNRWVLNDFHTA